MRNQIKTALAMLVLLPLPILQGCGDDPTGLGGIPARSPPGMYELPGLVVFPDTLALAPGETAQFGVSFGRMGEELVPPELEVTWTSSNPEVASVLGEGRVAAHREGKVLIRADHGGWMARAWVIVTLDAQLSDDFQG